MSHDIVSWLLLFQPVCKPGRKKWSRTGSKRPAKTACLEERSIRDEWSLMLLPPPTTPRSSSIIALHARPVTSIVGWFPLLCVLSVGSDMCGEVYMHHKSEFVSSQNFISCLTRVFFYCTILGPVSSAAASGFTIDASAQSSKCLLSEVLSKKSRTSCVW
jgi:hypothetical protein